MSRARPLPTQLDSALAFPAGIYATPQPSPGSKQQGWAPFVSPTCAILPVGKAFNLELSMQLLCVFLLLAALVGAIATCIGCSKKSPEPAVIHWKSQDGGFTDTTPASPAEKANAGNQ